MGQSAQLHARQPASAVMEHAIPDVPEHAWMAVINRVPVVVEKVAIPNVRDVIQSAPDVITHVYLRAKAFVSLRVMIIATAVVTLIVNQAVHLVVLIHVVLNVRVIANFSVIIHAKVRVLEIVIKQLCHTQYTNQV